MGESADRMSGSFAGPKTLRKRLKRFSNISSVEAEVLMGTQSKYSIRRWYYACLSLFYRLLNDFHWSREAIEV